MGLPDDAVEDALTTRGFVVVRQEPYVRAFQAAGVELATTDAEGRRWPYTRQLVGNLLWWAPRDYVQLADALWAISPINTGEKELGRILRAMRAAPDALEAGLAVGRLAGPEKMLSYLLAEISGCGVSVTAPRRLPGSG